MNNKKYKWIKEVVLVLIVLVAASGVFFFVSGKTGLIGDGAAIALQSWNQLFGGGSAQNVVSDGSVDDSVDLSDGSSTTASSSADSDAMGNNGIMQHPDSKTVVGKKSDNLAQQDDAVGGVAINSVDADANGTTIAEDNSNPDSSSSVSSSPISDSNDLNNAIDVDDSSATIAALVKTQPTACAFPTAAAIANTVSASSLSSRKIILNEIAWMGTPLQNGETDVKTSEHEWIELKNISSDTVALSGWKVLDSAKNISFTAADGAQIPVGGFYLLARGGGAILGQSVDASYTGTLPNAGDQVALLDAACGVEDFLDASASSGGWPGGNNISKQTLERDRDGGGWHTSVSPGGTPRAENSIPLIVETSTVAIDAPVFAPATSDIASSSSISPSSTSSNTPSTTPSAASVSHLLIAAVQIAGASSSNDFVKIYNPTGAPVDIGGWKLHKKSSTGTDYSLRTFGTGSTIAAGAYFVWANSTGGFSDSIGADASSTETLSADNSVALFDASGTIVDRVAWGTGTSQYVEGIAYPTDPTANQVLARKTSNGLIVDTDNNAQDFEIQ